MDPRGAPGGRREAARGARMKLDQALDEYGLRQRRLHTGDEAQVTSVALEALREFLMDHSGYEETHQITPRDFFSFLLDYYPSEEEPEEGVAEKLLETAAD